MYDIKQNWFYKMCVKQCTKDFALIFAGTLLIIAGILLFTAEVSVTNIALIIIGIVMSVNGVSACVLRLPTLREKMQRMSADELNSLGDAPPQCMYETFYFTPKYLCIPTAYALIRYDDISRITPKTVTRYGRPRNIYVVIEFASGQPPINVTVKNWWTFQREETQFIDLIEQYKNNMEV